NYFFQETSLGKYIQEEVEHLHREAPFAMLKEDPESGEKFVVRGIIDGYLLLENRIILFDYKTDKFVNPLELKERYQGQMALYAEALKKSYEIEKIDKYLILLGGKQLEVVKMD
ncbi:TPA: PD-(D/E)XK nuclease family protein, partial [Streptococcus agalactiae]